MGGTVHDRGSLFYVQKVTRIGSFLRLRTGKMLDFKLIWCYIIQIILNHFTNMFNKEAV